MKIMTKDGSQFKYFKAFYFLFIHLILIAVVMSSYSVRQFIFNFVGEADELTDHYHQMTAFHSRVDKNLSENYNLFIGDSLIQGLAVSSVDKMSVNYGIGNDTTFGVIKRLPLYNSLLSARRVILSIGHNDIERRSKTEIINNFQTIIEYIPKNKQVIICAIILVDEEVKTVGLSNAEIIALNQNIEDVIKNYSNVSYLNVNEILAPNDNLLANLHIGDGIHLNKAGNDIWIAELRKALNVR